MWKFTNILLLLILMTSASYAQIDTISVNPGSYLRLDGPISQSPSPLFIVTYKGKEYILDSLGVKGNVLDPNSIESMNVIKAREGLIPYGEAAKNGVVIVILKEERKSFVALKKHLKPLKLKSNHFD
jgi:hypothetical protein